VATQAHHLSTFSIHPQECIAEPGKDNWHIINGMMKTAFRWGETEMAVAILEMLNRGEHVLDGFVKFMSYFIFKRGLEGALFETKVDVLIKELANR
jgi:hypothetical protein